ncbi:MAG: dTMP kinase [Spirochaetaceae bacterium]|nr:dTMP kinase [Spirochaetaceae bacterium]
MQNSNIIKGFVVLEGIDGSGTTTQVLRLKNWLTNCGKSVFTTCEPTENEIGLFLRRCLSKKTTVQAETMPFLFASDRSEHIYGDNGILHHIQKGSIVISDRYLFSSLAYQGASGFFELAKKLNADFPLPEILFYFDIQPSRAFQRIEKRGTQKELYEVLQFQEKVAAQYELTLAHFETSPMRIIRIPAEQPEDIVFENLKTSLQMIFA